ncbi:HSF-type DNA-binding domain-containing protein [Mytilinidion resinicola]|uniref:HSF-type DNA-binding domain-containing protein n=1 Tax=Mytilinidion resinicola TaxID=574789 RepID=A0A6A6Z1B3_9PEZI|nr:HSF-type DNA-binding domain-containing protein [Mytilinidion resinicola]KAF2814074.1 HSF-type DNA-binding domain-containing protein [Mytilinidion resinicola]
MDVTPSMPTMGPPILSSPVGDRNGTNGDVESATNGNASTAIGAAAAAQQPKVVQTAFIHKLYNMLEDQGIQHLISWSNTNESFVMSPSSEFSKVLSSYFKHTNISSFVRQLNMYGFHKVSDVFHTGSPDSPLWEFKHGNGSFKRGDLVGLREIKRRASRHALIHRDSFSAGPKVPTGPPAGVPVEPMPDPVESRLGMLEHGYYEMTNRMNRAEDSYAYLNQKYQVVMEGLIKCHQWNHELTNYIMAMVHDPENQIYKDVSAMQREIAKQSEMLRAIEEPGEPLSARPPYFMQIDNAPPLSPRQMPQDDHRRASLAANSRQAPFRPPVPAHLAISPRRYGSIGTGTYSPSSARTPVHQPPPPPPPPIQHPASSSSSSPPYNLYRRHTSADIRLHGWQAPPPPPTHSPYASGQNSSQWPSSPHRTPISGGDQQIRDALAQYELPRNPRPQGSRQATPPLGNDAGPSNLSAESGWSLPGRAYPFKGIDVSGPPTRRSSMASNVHSLLNPAETAERADEDEQDPDARKRKRMQ